MQISVSQSTARDSPNISDTAEASVVPIPCLIIINYMIYNHRFTMDIHKTRKSECTLQKFVSSGGESLAEKESRKM